MKRFSLALLWVLLAFSLTACVTRSELAAQEAAKNAASNDTPKKEPISSSDSPIPKDEYTLDNNITSIEAYDFSSRLVYDQATGIVYIRVTTYLDKMYIPYLSSNGKLMRYENNELVEVSDTEYNNSYLYIPMY